MVCSRQSTGWDGLWRSFFPPVKFLEPYDSNQSAASLTLHENDAVHVQLTSGTSSSNREEEKPPEPITGFGSLARWNNELRCIGFGWLRSPISAINQESEDNIELLPLYHVPCVTLCALSLSCQTTLTNRQKKKKKKRDCQTVSAPQSWPRWAHSVSHTRVTVERGIKFGIDQNRDAAANCWRLAPSLMPAARRRHPRFFGHFWPSVWPSSRSNFDLGPSPLDSTEKIFHIRAYDFGVQFSFKFDIKLHLIPLQPTREYWLNVDMGFLLERVLCCQNCQKLDFNCRTSTTQYSSRGFVMDGETVSSIDTHKHFILTCIRYHRLLFSISHLTPYIYQGDFNNGS